MKWIDADDELPADNENTVVWCACKSTHTGETWVESGFVKTDDGIYTSCVSDVDGKTSSCNFWMHIPQYPKEQL